MFIKAFSLFARLLYYAIERILSNIIAVFNEVVSESSSTSYVRIHRSFGSERLLRKQENFIVVCCIQYVAYLYLEDLIQTQHRRTKVALVT